MVVQVQEVSSLFGFPIGFHPEETKRIGDQIFSKELSMIQTISWFGMHVKISQLYGTILPRLLRQKDRLNY